MDKLSLFNDAIRIIGERRLVSLVETSPLLPELNDAWDFGAANFCLQQIKPRFATVVRKITASTTDPDTGFSNVFTLPTDYLAMVAAYSDAKLDEPITRFIIEGLTLSTDHPTLYLRYISSDVTAGNNLALWTPTFARAVSSYLAKSICPRIRPNNVEAVTAEAKSLWELSVEIDGPEEPKPRSKPGTTTLTPEWLAVYNDALSCMSLPKLISVNDDSNRRAELDDAINSGAVQVLLEDSRWSWANTSKKIDNDISLDPQWGHRYAFSKPDDMVRLVGVFQDEYFRVPLTDYEDEGDNIYTSITTIYIQYVRDETTNSPGQWPAYFRTLVAAYIADKKAGILQGDTNKAEASLIKALSKAKNTDAMVSPPQIIRNGNWTRARISANNYRRGRP